ncbi:MAG TPA: transglutaminase domain-containing protein [Candidatus Cloacimonadota bacterium]|nr:transglutaminase domain-containing protein [Candidatus Cloacimonadota bacterium]HQB41538.1 transglutaminase domain-containing protein [Candidatus Cloacimonadota bacterium]
MEQFKKLILFFLITTIMLTGLIAKDNDELYNILFQKAQANINSLPSYCKKDYQSLLKKYPDRLMSFLLAYEESGSLAAGQSTIIENHYLSLKDLMDEKGISQPDEFFLSYIAKLTVTEEPISNYRHVFESEDNLDLKKIRATVKDDEDLYRVAMLKTNEILRYKPTSGRDQGPLDVANKSLYGRCEEWQILLVSIARTLGLPARPVSTPWWAHQDDNHAWAEFYINGTWRFDGDYYPNQSWIAGLSNKMIIITASSSLPAEDEEVLSQGEFGASVNSIKHYALENTRTLNIKVLDEANKPIPHCPIGIEVYNTYSLRPQTFIRCDENGEKTLSVGAGAFYLLAIKDSLSALQFIPAEGDKVQDITISLKNTVLSQEKSYMKYPNKQLNFTENPQSWREQSQTANDRWQAKVDKFEKEIKELNITDSLFVKVLETSRLNYRVWYDYLSKNPYSKEWLQALLDSDEKDLWLAESANYIERHQNWFEFIYPQISAMNKELILNIINPNTLYEPQPWQSYYLPSKDQSKNIYPKSMILKSKETPSPQQVIKHFSKKHKLNNKESLQGLLPLEIALNQKNLNSYQYKMLAINYLRANRIPAMYTRLPNVAGVYTNGSWNYYDLVKNEFFEQDSSTNEEESTQKITITCLDEEDQPITLEDHQLQISFIKDGQFFTLYEPINYEGNGVYTTNIPEKGMHYAQLGYRQSDSLTVYYLEPLKKNGQLIKDLSIVCDYFPRSWNDAEQFLSPIITEIEELGYNYAVVGNITHENSLRMAINLKNNEKTFVFLGYSESKSDAYTYQVSNVLLELIKEIPSMSNRTITLAKSDKDGKWKMYEGLWNKLLD